MAVTFRVCLRDLGMAQADNLRRPQGSVGIISREGKTRRFEGGCHLHTGSLAQIEIVLQCNGGDVRGLSRRHKQTRCGAHQATIRFMNTGGDGILPDRPPGLMMPAGLFEGGTGTTTGSLSARWCPLHVAVPRCPDPDGSCVPWPPPHIVLPLLFPVVSLRWSRQPCEARRMELDVQRMQACTYPNTFTRSVSAGTTAQRLLPACPAESLYSASTCTASPRRQSVTSSSRTSRRTRRLMSKGACRLCASCERADALAFVERRETR